jgi:hypothetical protein
MYWSWSTTSILTRIISSKETSQSERKTEAPCQRKTYIYCLRLSRSNLAHRKMHGRIWYCLVGCMQGSVRGSLNLLRDSSENDLIYMSHYNAIVLDSWPWLACWIYYNLIKSWTKLSLIILIQCYPLLYIFLENYCSLLAFVFVSPPLGFFTVSKHYAVLFVLHILRNYLYLENFIIKSIYFWNKAVYIYNFIIMLFKNWWLIDIAINSHNIRGYTALYIGSLW